MEYEIAFDANIRRFRRNYSQNTIKEARYSLDQNLFCIKSVFALSSIFENSL